MQSTDRLKLLEAIGFFLANTRHCGLVKLFKLLYYLDMLHFRETGRAVTGLRYRALPYGPVPTELYREVRNPPGDLNDAIIVMSPPPEAVESEAPNRTLIVLRKDLGTPHLTKREKRIAGEVAEIFRDATAEQISDVSHARNGPWDLAKKAGAGKWGTEIDYLDSINLAFGTGCSLSRAELTERLREYEEIRGHFA